MWEIGRYDEDWEQVLSRYIVSPPNIEDNQYFLFPENFLQLNYQPTFTFSSSIYHFRLCYLNEIFDTK